MKKVFENMFGDFFQKKSPESPKPEPLKKKGTRKEPLPKRDYLGRSEATAPEMQDEILVCQGENEKGEKCGFEIGWNDYKEQHKTEGSGTQCPKCKKNDALVTKSYLEGKYNPEDPGRDSY